MTKSIPNRIFLWEDEINDFLAGRRKQVQIGINQHPVRGLLTYVRVVQPEVDLEKEIDVFFYGKNFKRCNDGVSVPGALMRDWQNQHISRSLNTDEIRRFARHFAEWGAEHLKK